MAQEFPVSLPYCGAPPSPDALWWRWNLDPILLAVLVVLACLYALGAWRANRDARVLGGGARAAFYAGWAMTAAALISPLCPLSVSLFAARVGQHMMLALIAAPLVAAGRPVEAFRSLLGGADRRRRLAGSPQSNAVLAAAVTFAVLLWFWHTPVAYAATFAGTFVYWSMHVSMFAAALWLWSGLFDRRPARALAIVGAGVVSSVQMGFLGAIITFAPRPIYKPHALTTAAWGLTRLQDQQLGGAIMWVPGCVVFLVVAMLVLWQSLARAPWAQGAARLIRAAAR